MSINDAQASPAATPDAAGAGKRIPERVLAFKGTLFDFQGDVPSPAVAETMRYGELLRIAIEHCAAKDGAALTTRQRRALRKHMRIAFGAPGPGSVRVPVFVRDIAIPLLLALGIAQDAVPRGIQLVEDTIAGRASGEWLDAAPEGIRALGSSLPRKNRAEVLAGEDLESDDPKPLAQFDRNTKNLRKPAAAKATPTDKFVGTVSLERPLNGVVELKSRDSDGTQVTIRTGTGEYGLICSARNRRDVEYIIEGTFIRKGDVLTLNELTNMAASDVEDIVASVRQSFRRLRTEFLPHSAIYSDAAYLEGLVAGLISIGGPDLPRPAVFLNESSVSAEFCRPFGRLVVEVEEGMAAMYAAASGSPIGEPVFIERESDVAEQFRFATDMLETWESVVRISTETS